MTGTKDFRFLDDLDRGKRYWGESRPLLRYPYPGDGDAVVIADKNLLNDFDEVIGLDLVKPGDLMFYDYEGASQSSGGDHLAIVQEVTDANGNGEIELNEIQLIESTRGTEAGEKFGNVIQARTIGTYDENDDNPRNWVIVRLK